MFPQRDETTGLVSVKKTNGKLVFIELQKGFEDRNQSLINLVKLADENYNLADFNTRLFSTGDTYNLEADYSYSSIDVEDTYPDFVFDKWKTVGIDSYTEIINELCRLDRKKWDENKVGWIGNSNVVDLRKRFIGIGFENQDIFDFMDSGVWRKNIKSDRLETTKDPFISLPELCRKYRALIDIEGWGYSGRLKLLLHSGKPLIIVDRPYKEFFFDKLAPYVHYVPVRRDLGDLVEKALWIFENEAESEEIGQNARIFAKNNLNVNSALSRFKEILEK